MADKNLIYGKHAVNEFAKKHPKLIKEIWTSEINNKLNNENQKIKVTKVSKETLDNFFEIPVNHQNIVAEVKEYNYLPFKDLINSLEKKSKSIVLMLDQIQDPFNFGAMIRTASLLNINEIVILDHKQVLITPTVVKTSAGTVYDMNISKVANLSVAIKEFKKCGFWIYSTNLNKDAHDIRTIDFSSKCVIVIGNEHNGVSDLVTKNSDLNFFIPSNKNIDSYNANVAASIAMFLVSNKIGLI